MPTPEFSLVSLVLPPRTRLTSEWRHSETLESLALLALFGLKKAGFSPISSSATQSGLTLAAESPTFEPPPRVAGSLTLLMPALHGIYLLAASPRTTQPAHWLAQGRSQNVSHGHQPSPGRHPSPRRRWYLYHYRAKSPKPGVPPRSVSSTTQSTTSTTSAISTSSTGRRCACRNFGARPSTSL